MPWSFYDKFGQKRSTAAQVPGALTLLRDRTLVDINTTAALTTLVSQTIPAGAVGLLQRIRARIDGDWLDNSGVNAGARVQVSLGGTVLWDGTNASMGANTANRAPFGIEFDIFALNSLTSVYLSGRQVMEDGSNGVPTTGLGSLGNVAAGSPIRSNGAVTIPTLANAQTLLVSVAPSASNALLSFRKFVADIEIF